MFARRDVRGRLLHPGRRRPRSTPRAQRRLVHGNLHALTSLSRASSRPPRLSVTTFRDIPVRCPSARTGMSRHPLGVMLSRGRDVIHPQPALYV